MITILDSSTCVCLAKGANISVAERHALLSAMEGLRDLRDLVLTEREAGRILDLDQQRNSTQHDEALYQAWRRAHDALTDKLTALFVDVPRMP